MILYYTLTKIEQDDRIELRARKFIINKVESRNRNKAYEKFSRTLATKEGKELGILEGLQVGESKGIQIGEARGKADERVEIAKKYYPKIAIFL